MIAANAGTTVVPIRPRVKVPKVNRQADQQTISTRRIRDAMHQGVMNTTGEDQVTALALEWRAEDALPCSRLRLIAGTLDQRRDLSVRLQDVEIARAERDARDAKRWRTRLLYGADAADAMHSEGERLFERYRQAVMDLANTQALTRHDIDRKKRAIGRTWLNAEGAWYDQLRAAIAEDEARLSAAKQGRR